MDTSDGDRVLRLQRLRQTTAIERARIKKARACASLLPDDLARMPLVCEAVQVPKVRTDGAGFIGFTELVRASFKAILSQADDLKQLNLQIKHLEGKVAGLEGELEARRSAKGGVQ
jgi:hypothetical protein